MSIADTMGFLNPIIARSAPKVRARRSAPYRLLSLNKACIDCHYLHTGHTLIHTPLYDIVMTGTRLNDKEHWTCSHKLYNPVGEMGQ